MKIYNYHPTTHVFISEGEADPSPLEEGVWLIPGDATDVAPPKIPVGMRAIWEGDKWRTENIPMPEPEPEPSEPTEADKLGWCKSEAAGLLFATDFSQIPDAAALLENKAEFDEFRSAVRKFVMKPVVDPVFPATPKAVWKE
jgi:hypothetical protein